MHHLVDPSLRVNRLLVAKPLRQAATRAVFHDQRQLFLVSEMVMEGDDTWHVQPCQRPHLNQKFLVLVGVRSGQKFDGDMVIAQHRVLRQPHLAKATLAQGVQQPILVVKLVASFKRHGAVLQITLQPLVPHMHAVPSP